MYDISGTAIIGSWSPDTLRSRVAITQAANNNALLLGALVIAEAWRKGGFFAVDTVALPVAAVGLALATAEGRSFVRRHLVLFAWSLALLGWWVVSGLRDDSGLLGLRMPATAIALVAAAVATRALPVASRDVLRGFLPSIGAATALAGLVSLAAGSSFWIYADERSRRLSGSFTYPSALGLFLVLCLLASLDQTTLRGRLLRVAQSLLLVGILATDSRGSVLALVVVIVLASRDQRQQVMIALLSTLAAAPLLLLGQRSHGAGLPVGVALAAAVSVGIAAAAPMSRLPSPGRNGRSLRSTRWLGVGVLSCCAGAALWLLGTQHRAVSGLDASWTERTRILRSAVAAFGSHPWWGAGPDPVFVSRTATGVVGIAYFAHNEPLEIALSIGVVGAALVVALIAAAIRTFDGAHTPNARAVAVALLVAGLVDFVWHFPALGLVAGIVLGSVPSQPSISAAAASSLPKEAIA